MIQPSSYCKSPQVSHRLIKKPKTPSYLHFCENKRAELRPYMQLLLHFHIKNLTGLIQYEMSFVLQH